MVRRLLQHRLSRQTEKGSRCDALQRRRRWREAQALAAAADPMVSSCDWPLARGQATGKVQKVEGWLVKKKKRKEKKKRVANWPFFNKLPLGVPVALPGGAMVHNQPDRPNRKGSRLSALHNWSIGSCPLRVSLCESHLHKIVSAHCNQPTGWSLCTKTTAPQLLKLAWRFRPRVHLHPRQNGPVSSLHCPVGEADESPQLAIDMCFAPYWKAKNSNYITDMRFYKYHNSPTVNLCRSE